MIYAVWLQNATQKLTIAGIPTARLDALLLLESATGQARAYLLAHPETTLQGLTLQKLRGMLGRRLLREPMAYILGTKEFYGREFTITKDVLVPRPESETFIELLKNIHKLAPTKEPTLKKRLLDVGTGSGILAVSAKVEFADLEVYASDVSDAALLVAKDNADRLGVNVTFLQADLLDGIEQKFDIILANLPYVPEGYAVELELGFEPRQALYAKDNGLALIEKLLIQAPARLKKNGHLLIEGLPSQHQQIKRSAYANGFKLETEADFVLSFVKG